jgi:hypothetical protein
MTTSLDEGVREAGRRALDIEIGRVFHTLMTENMATLGASADLWWPSATRCCSMSRICPGAGVRKLNERVWPNFHHTPDLARSGDVFDLYAGGGAMC